MQDRDTQANSLGFYTSLLALMEGGLGSLLHAWHIPLTGHFLSLNQIFLMSRLVIQTGQKQDPFYISVCAALLKTLAPIGKKFTPMLALTMQGFLFSLGLTVGGTSFWGLLIGSLLASLWAFIQPLWLYYLIFGHALFDAFEKIFDRAAALLNLQSGSFYLLLGVLILLKVLLAWGAILLSFRLSDVKIEGYYRYFLSYRYFKRRSSMSKGKGLKPLKGACADLCRPLFLLSLALSISFALVTEQDEVALFWSFLRPLAVGLLIFWGIRAFNIEPILKRVHTFCPPRLASALKVVFDQLNEYSKERS